MHTGGRCVSINTKYLVVRDNGARIRPTSMVKQFLGWLVGKGIVMTHTTRKSYPWLILSLLAPLALLVSACLPDGVRVPQSQLSGLLERKAGLIAYLGIDGNIYTIDQVGQRKTQITKDAFLNNNDFMFYGLPTWAPDSNSIAFAS